MGDTQLSTIFEHIDIPTFHRIEKVPENVRRKVQLVSILTVHTLMERFCKRYLTPFYNGEYIIWQHWQNGEMTGNIETWWMPHFHQDHASPWTMNWTISSFPCTHFYIMMHRCCWWYAHSWNTFGTYLKKHEKSRFVFLQRFYIMI